MRNVETAPTWESADNSSEEKNGNNEVAGNTENTECPQEVIDDFFHRKAENRNFQLDFRVENGEAAVIIKNENGDVMDLQKYVPEGYRLIPDGRFECNRADKTVHFDPNEVDNKGFVLSLAHEIGHAKREKRKDVFDANFFKMIGSLAINHVRRAIKLQFETRHLNRQEKKDKLKKELLSMPTESFIPLRYLEKESEKSAISERNAWAESLKMLRQLEREGFNVFEEFESVEEIRAYIAYCLFTHEMNAEYEQQLSIGGESQKQYRRKFMRSKDLDALDKYMNKK